VKGNFIVSSSEALYEAVLAGLGISRVVAFLADEALRSGQLVRLLSEYEDESDIGAYAVFPSNRHLLPKVRCFVEFLIQSISRSN
jgi:DNA-binding transcriptional LysR family regulator